MIQHGPSMQTEDPGSPQEQARLAALESYRVFDSPPEQAYDDLTQLASFICRTPMSLVSLVGAERQFFKSAHGLDLFETQRDVSFCAHTLETGKQLIVEDATQDERFAQNPLVTGAPRIRFYAGSPIVTREGHVLGTLCVLDTEPRQLTEEQSRALEALARQATELLEQRRLIADQEKAAEAAKKAALQLKLTTEAGKLSVFSWAVHEDCLTWENARIYDIIGRTKDHESASAANFIEHVVHPAYRDTFTEAAQAIRRSGDRFHWLGKVLHGDGSVRWVELQGLAEETLNGTLNLIGTAFDATERKQLEETLLADRERLQTALRATLATTFDWQLADDTIEWHGPSPFGRDPETLVGSGSVFELVHPEDTPGLEKAVEDALAGRAPYQHEFRALWPDGSIHWVRARGEVVRDDSELPVRFVGINLDVTDRKLSEQALLRTEKLAAVGRLASTISHEINNPLEAITNLLFIVRGSPSLTQADRDHLELADRELSRVTQITAQTLRFHRSPSKATLIEGNQLLHDSLALYRSRLMSSGVKIKLDLGEEVLFSAFEGDIRQVLNNLLGNAFDVMRRGGTLRIRTRLGTDRSSMRSGVVVTIADTGCGIPRDVGARVFDEFFSTKGIHGTGLGLWVSKRIVHKHRGKLTFRSRTGTSHGTVFRLWLPLEAAPSAGDAWA